LPGRDLDLCLGAVSLPQRSHGAIDEEGETMKPFMKNAAKAILAAAIAALGSLATVLVGDTGFGDLTAGQWVTIALAVAVAFGGVYGVRNAQPA